MREPIRVPYGVEVADRERDIIAEQRRAEMRIVAPCEHDALSVFLSRGDVFDDHRTSYGHCKSCEEWVVRVDFVNGFSESRPMTPAEIKRIEANEARYRRQDAN